MSSRGEGARHASLGWLGLSIGLALVPMPSVAQTSPQAPPGTRSPTTAARPTIKVPATVQLAPDAPTPLPIVIGPAEALPKNSYLRIRGLPSSATLSEGHAIAPGAWAIPINGLPSLTVVVRSGFSGAADTLITISLVTLDGAILTEAQATLAIGRSSPAKPPAARSSSVPLAVEPAPSSPASPPPASQPAFAGAMALLPSVGAGSAPVSSGAGSAPVSPVAASAKTASLPPPTRPAAVPPAIAPADKTRALSLVQMGEERLASGNIVAARLLFQRAAELGWPPAAIAAGATYDPVELARLKVRGMSPDIAEARRWYERALSLGADEAETLLRRLEAR